MLHTTYKLYMISVCSQLLHLVIMCATYAQYGTDGIENYTAKTFGIEPSYLTQLNKKAFLYPHRLGLQRRL